MKNHITALLTGLLIMAMFACQKKDSFPGTTVSPYVAILDIRNLPNSYSDVISLTSENLNGGDSIAAIVISDHSGNNLPDSLLIVQDARRLSALRGIALTIANASDYTVGDSVIIKVKGATLQRKDGILQILGVSSSGIRKVSSGNTIAYNQLKTSTVLASPNIYESTLIDIVKGGPNPVPDSGTTLAGTYAINDAYGNLNLVTETTATFADALLPGLANYKSILLNNIVADTLAPYMKISTYDDITVLGDLSDVAVIITGFMCNPNGTDANYEYIQCRATEDIDFSVTPYALVTTNNAGASTPTGYPSAGWATGGLRTYKMNIASGTVSKGDFFYVGGTTKVIDGSGSTSMASSIWYGYAYNTLAGVGFGTATSNLLANSGNTSGIAIFADSAVTESSIPIDVVFIDEGGTLYSESAGLGYRIANNDYYDIINPLTSVSQPFYLAGTNTGYAASYNSSIDDPYTMLGGVFNISLKRWTTVRSATYISLTTTSTVSEIESASNVTQLDE
ncbi:MAG: DUF5689 domain-containing protein [Chitinophagaceae bacterium]